jgi:Glycosyltransferase family 87
VEREAGGARRPNLRPRILRADMAPRRSHPTAWVLYAEPVIGILGIAVATSTVAAVAAITGTAPNDFTVFLESARWLRQGADLYQPPLRPGPGYNLNPPAAVLLFVPFSFLPDSVALYLWTALAMGAYLLAAYWIAREVMPGRTVSIAGAIFLSQPAIMSLLLGQIGALMMLLLTAAWIADRQERPLVAGTLLGIAIGAKPFLLVFAAYALWRRSTAFAAGLAAGTAGMVTLGLAAAGVAGFRSWLRAIEQITWSAHVANASLLALLTRTLSVTPEILHATPMAVRPDLVPPLWWASVAIVCATTAVILRRTRNRDQAWAIVLIASLLVSPLGWVYYATMFVGPLLAVAMKGSRPAQVVIAAGCACLYVPPMSMPSLGSAAVLVFGSIYAWGFLLLFAGVAMSALKVAQPFRAANGISQG